jgi:20S proteasome subunit alpha 7
MFSVTYTDCECYKLICRMHSIRDDEKPFELEMAWICEASGRKFQQIPQDVIADAEKKAKEAIEAADMSSPTPPFTR